MGVRTILAALLLAGVLAAPAQGAGATRHPTGALFALDYRAGPHFCSASVVHSRGHDLIATAAHCVTGSGAGLEFVPGYDRGRAPLGAWRVTAAYVDPAWLSKHDPHHDFAFLRLAPLHNKQIESRTGALTLGHAPRARALVRMKGYVAGTDDSELHCSTRSYRTSGYPAVDCEGFAGGTSGGAWISRNRLVGLTGGLHQGGCSPDTSYSAPFGHATRALFNRAQRGGAGDVLLPAPDDGC